MKMFSYHARAADGTRVRGKLAAESAPAAARMLAAEAGAAVYDVPWQRGRSLCAFTSSTIFACRLHCI